MSTCFDPEAFGEAMGNLIREAVEPLEKRIAELERRAESEQEKRIAALERAIAANSKGAA